MNKLVVTGSIATDHLMHFPGRFADQFIEGALDKVYLSFLVDDLVVRRGGVAPNIAFGMGQLGLTSTLVGAVGPDFDDYRSWLEQHGVDCQSLHYSEVAHTARFVCTTDDDMNQIGSFYGGAMAEARNISLEPVVERLGGIDLVIIGPNDPTAMLRHAEECRTLGIPFAADPSQQLARMSGEEAGAFIDGAAFLFTNEYEKELLESKSGYSDEQILDRVGIRVTTLGKNGCRIMGRGMDTIEVPAVSDVEAYEPTGAGDAFRAGFFAGLSWGLDLARCAEVGSLLAALVLETVGTQEYVLDADAFIKRFAAAYGDAAADEIRPHMTRA